MYVCDQGHEIELHMSVLKLTSICCNKNSVMIFLHLRPIYTYLCPSKSPSKFIIVPMVMDHLMGRLVSEPILSINVNLTEKGTETIRVNGP